MTTTFVFNTGHFNNGHPVFLFAHGPTAFGQPTFANDEPIKKSTPQSFLDNLPVYVVSDDGEERARLMTLGVKELKDKLKAFGLEDRHLEKHFLEKSQLVDMILQAPLAVRSAKGELNRRRLSKSSLKDSERTCTICVEDFKGGDVVTMLPKCGHYFHADKGDCPGVFTWLRDHATSCPNCKTEVCGACT